MASGRVKPEGGVRRFRVGRDGRTLLAEGKDGKEYIVSEERGGTSREARKKVERRSKALNQELLEQAKQGRRDMA